MKTLNDYLMESAKTYEFRLKTCCELSDDQLDSLEKHMRKYEAFDIESPKRTILQSAPLDFHNVGATEIYIMDFKTKLPMSPAMLVNELVQKIGITITTTTTTTITKTSRKDKIVIILLLLKQLTTSNAGHTAVTETRLVHQAALYRH